MKIFKIFCKLKKLKQKKKLGQYKELSGMVANHHIRVQILFVYFFQTKLIQLLKWNSVFKNEASLGWTEWQNQCFRSFLIFFPEMY